MEKSLIVNLDGGLGRVLCAEPAIAKLKETGNRVIVVTGHPQVFWHNPNVYKIYGGDHPYLWDDVVRHGIFKNPEPYHDYLYYTQKAHLIDTFYHLLVGTPPTQELKPKLYLTPDEIAWGKNLIQNVKNVMKVEKLAAFHPFGAAARFTPTPCDGSYVVDNTVRSLSTETVDAVCNHFKEKTLGFMSCSTIRIEHNNVWNQQYNQRELFAMINACDFIVSVDSCTTHIGAAFEKQGLCFMGSTFLENVGYTHYKNYVKEGYPKAYFPNRFQGFIVDNTGAFNYNPDELKEIITHIEEFL